MNINQPLNLYWQSETRYYRVIFQQDLFLRWELLRFWGGKNNKRHGQKREIMTSYAHGVGQIETIKKTRHKRDYVLLLQEPF